MVNSSLIGVEKQGLSLSLSAARDATDRTQAGSLCYFHAVASSLWVHSGSFCGWLWSLDCPENNVA